jgi:glycosyltransferase involved in cell wall biosynthesis
MKTGVLYISYDGMLEPLGQSQVLAYLEKLATAYSITIISYEKKGDWSNKALRSRIAGRIRGAGMRWIPLRYHKSPTAPATAFDVAVGTAVALWISVQHRIVIVHARSYIAALIALVVKRLLGREFLFDMRGLWADERIDAGLWPADGGLYRVTKSLEKHFLLGADQIVTLTHASAEEIRQFSYLRGAGPAIEVIPTCTDLDRFHPDGHRPARPFVLGYVGSIGTWYLFDEILSCFRIALEMEPDARLLVVNRNEQALVRDRVEAAGIDPALTEIVSAEHRAMPAIIRRMSAGAAIIKPSYSKIASAPTKIAEYLACGVPCLGNSNIGDVEAILEGNRVGVVLRGFSEPELRPAVRNLIDLSREPDIKERCRSAAARIFSLEDGARAYGDIYRRLIALAESEA